VNWWHVTLQAKGDPSSQAQLTERKLPANAVTVAATRGLHIVSCLLSYAVDNYKCNC